MIKARVTEGSPAVFFHSSFYTRLIEEASGRKLKLTRDRREVELELGLYTPTISYKAAQSIDSVLGRKIGRRVTYAQVTRRQWRGRLHRTVPRVWFTGENVRPPSDGWDLTLTFDLDNLNGTNEYCPLWWGEINLIPGVKSASRERVGREMTVEEFLTPRFINLDERPGFVCAFVNNPEPMRLHAVRMLRRLGPVHVYGRVAGRPTGPKIDIARKYRYCLSFENDVYPGYVTEKPFEAWASGCVPIWRGSDPSGYLNEKAMLNAAEGGLDAMVEQISELECDTNKYVEMASAPLLKKRPDASKLLRRISELIDRF